MKTEIVEIPVSKIISPRNSRMSESDDVSGLMNSIKQLGQLQPIAVTQQGDEYRIIYGNRRFDAIKKLGFGTVACVVKSEMDDVQEVKENLAENTARKSVTGSELYKYILHLSTNGLSDAEISANIGIPVTRIKDIKKAGKSLKLQYLDKLEVDFPNRGGNKVGRSKGRPKKGNTSLSSNMITKLVTLKRSYGPYFTEDVVDHIMKNHQKMNPKNLFQYVAYAKKKKLESTPKLFDLYASHMDVKSVALTVMLPVKDIEKYGIRAIVSKLKKDMVKVGILQREGNI